MRFLTLLVLTPSLSFAMNLQEFLATVQSKHKTSQALEVQKEAADLRNVAGDIALVPVFTAGTYFVQDKSPLNQFASLGATESKVTDFNLGFSKKFASGTSLGLSVDVSENENPGLAGAFSRYTKFGSGALGVSVSQSLWKDSLGNATKLRRELQNVTTASEKGRYDLQLKALLVGAEQAYWSYLYAIESVQISRDSLERAKRIEAWTKRRVSDGISDRADLLQTQALVSTRQLFLIAAEDELAATTQSLRDYLEIDKAAKLPSMTGDISAPRSLNSFLQTVRRIDESSKAKVLLLDAYLSSFDAKARNVAVDQVEDSYKPDLTLAGSYQTHAFDSDLASVVAGVTKTDSPTSKVSLNLTYMFDDEVKGAARSSVRRDALAAKLSSERKQLESESLWSELARRNAELTKQIEIADQVTKIQDERAKAEAALFNKGRSITANVVNAEEDVGSAKLNLIKLKSAQRKMEAQARLFVSVE
jgi:outer membrane protein TolC